MSRQTSSQGSAGGTRNLPLRQERGEGFKQTPTRGTNPGGGGDKGSGGAGNRGIQCYKVCFVSLYVAALMHRCSVKVSVILPDIVLKHEEEWVSLVIK